MKFNCLHCPGLVTFNLFTDLVNHYTTYHQKAYRLILARPKLVLSKYTMEE